MNRSLTKHLEVVHTTHIDLYCHCLVVFTQNLTILYCPLLLFPCHYQPLMVSTAQLFNVPYCTNFIYCPNYIWCPLMPLLHLLPFLCILLLQMYLVLLTVSYCIYYHLHPSTSFTVSTVPYYRYGSLQPYFHLNHLNVICLYILSRFIPHIVHILHRIDISYSPYSFYSILPYTTHHFPTDYNNPTSSSVRLI